MKSDSCTLTGCLGQRPTYDVKSVKISLHEAPTIAVLQRWSDTERSVICMLHVRVLDVCPMSKHTEVGTCSGTACKQSPNLPLERHVATTLRFWQDPEGKSGGATWPGCKLANLAQGQAVLANLSTRLRLATPLPTSNATP